MISEQSKKLCNTIALWVAWAAVAGFFLALIVLAWMYDLLNLLGALAIFLAVLGVVSLIVITAGVLARRRSKGVAAPITPVRSKNISNAITLWSIWVVVVGFLLALFIVAAAAMGGGLPVGGFPFGAGILIVILIMIWRSMRRRRSLIILGYIEEAVRLNLPLPPMMLAAARSESGTTRFRLFSLHHRLEQGQGLETALRLAAPEVPRRIASAIGAAEQVGRLPHMLARLMGRAMRRERRGTELTGFYQGYAILFFFLGVLGIGSMILIFVMPKFRLILHDFHAQSPWAMRLFLDIARYVSEPYALLLIAILLLSVPLWRKAWEYVLWWTPLAGHVRDRGLGDLCDFLADAVDAGQPMDEALLGAVETQSNPVLRARVQNWSRALAAGKSVSEAARSARMPALLVGMLATIRSGEDLFQVMSFLARYYESRFSRFYEVLRATYVPLLVFAMGAVVLLIELSIFQTLIRLTDATSHFYGGF